MATVTFTDPDGQPVVIDTDDLVHMDGRIQYTTLIVKHGTFTRRVVVTETTDKVREMRTAALKELPGRRGWR